MSISLEAFPTLTDQLLRDSGLDKIHWNKNNGFVKFSYLKNGHKMPLEEKIISNHVASPVFTLKDNEYEWSLDEHKFIVDISFDIEDPSVLFGARGIVPFNGELWVGVIITSKSSSYRNAYLFKKRINKANACTGKKNKKLHIEGSLSIEPGLLRGNVSFELVFVLGNPGSNNTVAESCMAKKVGTILGDIAEFRVYLEGDGALFPVKEESVEGGPLWRVMYDCLYPDCTPFDEESFCLYMNTAHPDYAVVNRDGKDENTLIYDIASSALEILFENLFRDDYNVKMLNNDEFEDDSIAFVVKQMMTYMNIATSDPPEVIHYKIRHYIQGGDLL